MVNAVRPTFGPVHGTVMISRLDHSRLPELLDDGGVIARRIIELPDRNEDVGAMMVRHLMWRIHERYGDASVTAALIYQSVFDQGIKYVLNGSNAMLLRRHLEEGARLVLNALNNETFPISNREQLTHLAKSICQDGEIAQNLGDILSKVGSMGHVEVRAGHGRDTFIEYIHGMTWKGEFFTRNMIQDALKVRSEIENPAILVSNLIIDNPYHLAEWLEKINRAGIKRLFVLAKQISPECLSVLEAARRSPEIFDVLAVKLWETTERWELQDLAIFTGGAMIVREAGYSLPQIHPEYLGHARQVWIERNRFGIIDGGGNSDQIIRHHKELLNALTHVKEEKFRRKLQNRLASLAGVSAIYWMGGTTAIEIEERVKVAQRTANAMRGAMTDGILPGGAISLLACIPVLSEMRQSEDFHRRAAGKIIARALEVPIYTLLNNCGENAPRILAQIQRLGKGYGFDINTRKIVPMIDAGIIDVANAVKAAVYAGITGAALGLTVDVVVHPQKRKESFTTG